MVEQPTTGEKMLSKTKEEVIREAKRIEESLLHSSKGHFSASHFWGNFHLWLGIPIVILSAIAGVSALSQFDNSGTVAGMLAILVAALSSVATFLNPNDKEAAHLTAGNRYDLLMSQVRIFWAIDCWREDSDQVLTERLKNLSDRKGDLNQSCLQIPRWAYRIAKKGIDAGEGSYKVDDGS